MFLENMIKKLLEELGNTATAALPSCRHDMESWDSWVAATLSKLAGKRLLRSVRPIYLPSSEPKVEAFDGPRAWDRSSVEVELDEHTFQEWLQELPNPDGELLCENEKGRKKMILFSGNDYLGLSTHPALRIAASEAAQMHGMGPRGSGTICGYTSYHKQLEASLAELTSKEDCLLCPSGFSANMAFMTTLGSISSLLAVNGKPSKDERIAIFSDALNHASIIDGIRLAEKQQEAEVYVYRHSDMDHLSSLLSSCTLKKKVVVTDSIFSMDGDFAPMADLVKLRNKHHFLLAIDDAHGTLVCGRNGGGLPEAYECENDVDIYMSGLSKAAGCVGGFIACSHKWKQLIQTRGRAFIFSTTIPVPIVAASLASLTVVRQEKWRVREMWSRVHDFRSLTLLPITSPIISLIVGSEEAALLASRHMLKSGFHVISIRPPTVPPNSCRLRITLSAAHTTDDVKKLVTALSQCVKLPAFKHNGLIGSKL